MDTAKTAKGHPKGLYLLFMTEMWERFSYYGMRAIFVLYMTKMLLMGDAEASEIYGSYTGLVYLTPLLGGYLADRYLGNRRSIEIGGILMAIGQFILFFSASATGASAVTLMWMGLTMLIIGNGFFKPNISTMVGQLYPQGDRRVDSAFTIFYMGINLGAFMSPLICGTLAEKVDFKWGFLAAGIGMLIGLVTFIISKNKVLVDADNKPIGLPTNKFGIAQWGMVIGSIGLIFFLMNFKTMFNSDLDVIGYLIYGAMILMPLIVLTDKSLTKDEKDRIIVIFILAFFVIFFWGAFEQAGASLTIFADRQTDRNLFGWEMPASYFQSVNALAILLLAPLFSSIWLRLGNRGKEPSSPKKMAYGLALISFGYLVIAYAVYGLGMMDKVSMFWLIGLYVIHTMGELCLSPIGLSMVSKLSPVRFSSLLMGTWFLANAAANKFAGTLSALIPGGGESGEAPKTTSFMGFQITDLFDFFIVFVIMCGVAALILFVISRWLEKKMHGIK
ncbi:peptide ABC transporter [Chryseobacterium formosense]|uniref:Peptide ABC transporter n=1 Tax=Chryseobacterium formosense TaxID=236814 RepID=A0A085Z6K8_9FLAO|nr:MULTISPECIES: peptide MFS transporter [Chryseobacterium]KFF00072.1 peptide ABC transporter [Chryseobacterium formosense]OCK53321.1 peptide ABC transporter [Chryseobacterium sp. CBo1]SFT61595.1 proton-dependent oligopeptide transporter, POT family [Chryseobacterium formosense]